MIKQIKKIYFNKKKNILYINNIKKRDLVNIIKYVKTNKKQIDLKNMYTTYTQSRLKIQLINN